MKKVNVCVGARFYLRSLSIKSLFVTHISHISCVTAPMSYLFSIVNILYCYLLNGKYGLFHVNTEEGLQLLRVDVV